MKEPIYGLEPKLLWNHFYNISKIPRCSKDEVRVRDYIVNLAKSNALEYKIDSIGNLVVKKSARQGFENKAPIALQSHLDMVCEKNEHVKHDFSNDPIILKKEGDWIKAVGTTLGADNGIGVAAALALMESDELNHGPLEFLFTLDEETGLTGAISLSPDMVESRILINLDSEEEGVIYNGCAGGKYVELLFKHETEKVPAGFMPFSIKLTGLTGGHSGLNIHEGRGNAIKLLNRFIWTELSQLEVKIASFEGGNKHNAIPREANAIVFVPNDKIVMLNNIIKEYNKILNDEHKPIDSNINISVNEFGFDVPDVVFSGGLQKQFLNLIYSIPNGVTTMSNSIPGLVETSNNLAVVRSKDDKISIVTSQRGMMKSKLVDIHNMIKACGYQAMAEVESVGGYPPWQPNPESPFLKKAKNLYGNMFNKEPLIKAIHAGLECGIIGDKFPGMDMISIGPTIMGTHSPDESVQISTMEKFWKFLVTLLIDCKN